MDDLDHVIRGLATDRAGKGGRSGTRLWRIEIPGIYVEGGIWAKI